MKTMMIALMAFYLGLFLCSGVQAASEPGSVENISPVSNPDTLLKTVLENNRLLRTARESFQVAVLEAGTGNTPPNPEVEFGYLFGKPAEMGNRIDFSVTQQVDFPTTYIHRSRLKKLKTSRAELKYLATRQEVLLQAKQLWIERIFLNQQAALLLTRLEQARRINSHQKQKLESGEVGQLDFNQSNLQVATLEGEYARVQSQIRTNQLAIKEITGGFELDMDGSVFPSPVAMIADSLLEAYSMSPELQLRIHMQEFREEEKSVIAGENLPKLSAGYYSESVLDQNFKGFQVGFTVPLWENSNRIKKARSEVVLAEAEAERFTYLQQSELLQQLEQLASLKNRTAQLEEALRAGNSMELLDLALESGEISLSEYYYSSGFHFRSQLLLLEYQRDLLLLEASLLKVYL